MQEDKRTLRFAWMEHGRAVSLDIQPSRSFGQLFDPLHQGVRVSFEARIEFPHDMLPPVCGFFCDPAQKTC